MEEEWVYEDKEGGEKQGSVPWREFWRLNLWGLKYFYRLRPGSAWLIFGLSILADGKSVAATAMLSLLLNFALKISSAKEIGIYDAMPILLAYACYNAAVSILDFSNDRVRARTSDYFGGVLRRAFYDKLIASPEAEKRTDLAKIFESLPQLVTNYFRSIKVLSSMVSFVALGVALLFFAPILVPVLILLVVPLFVADSRYRKMLAKATEENSGMYKADMAMAGNLLISERLKSLKREGLAGFVSSRYQKTREKFSRIQNGVKAKWNVTRKSLVAVSDAATVAGFAMVLSRLFLKGVSIGSVYFQMRLIELFKAKVNETLTLIDTLYESFAKARQAAEIFHLPGGDAGGRRVLREPPSLEVTGLTFPIEEKASRSLDDVSFFVKAGGKLAIVVTEGPGRAAIYQILSKSLQGYSGRVSVWGREMGDVDNKEYFDSVAMLSPTNYFFHLSIGENIALGRPDEPVDEERVAASIRAVGVDGEIGSLPRGLGQTFDERVGPSAKPRFELVVKLLIARMVYRKPRMAIINLPGGVDANPNLAYSVVRGIYRGLAESTVVVMGMWPAVGLGADEMVVLAKGRVVKRGKYEELYPRQPQAVVPKVENESSG